MDSVFRTGNELQFICKIDGIRNKRERIHDSLGKSGNFHILIKPDNSIHVEGENSPRPIEHVHASGEKGE